MKKIYVKPCSVCMSMAVENAMLAGSGGVTVTDGGFTPQPPQKWGAKQNPFSNEEEEKEQ